MSVAVERRRRVGLLRDAIVGKVESGCREEVKDETREMIELNEVILLLVRLRFPD